MLPGPPRDGVGLANVQEVLLTDLVLCLVSHLTPDDVDRGVRLKQLAAFGSELPVINLGIYSVERLLHEAALFAKGHVHDD